jgi:hypothetical protein
VILEAEAASGEMYTTMSKTDIVKLEQDTTEKIKVSSHACSGIILDREIETAIEQC